MSEVSYKTQIKKGGVPVSQIGIQMVSIAPEIYRISDSTKKVIDRNQAIDLVDEFGDPLGDVTINYNEGIILFDTTPAGEVYIDYYFIPLSFIGGAKDYDLSITGDILDDTAFHDGATANAGNRTRKPGLLDVSLSFSKFSDTSKFIRSKKLAGQDVFITIQPALSNISISGWFTIESSAVSGDVGSLEDESYSFVLNGSIENAFSYIIDYTDPQIALMSEPELIANYFIQ